MSRYECYAERGHAPIRGQRRCHGGAGEAKTVPARGNKFLVKGRGLELMFPRLIISSLTSRVCDAAARVDAKHDHGACGTLRL